MQVEKCAKSFLESMFDKYARLEEKERVAFYDLLKKRSVNRTSLKMLGKKHFLQLEIKKKEAL